MGHFLNRGYRECLHVQVTFSMSCQLVTPKHVVAGTLRLTNLHLHFVGDHASEDTSGAEARPVGAAKPTRTHKRWAVSAIIELHHARFLLQQSALEIFLADRSNALLNFDGNAVRRTACLTHSGSMPTTWVAAGYLSMTCPAHRREYLARHVQGCKNAMSEVLWKCVGAGKIVS